LAGLLALLRPSLLLRLAPPCLITLATGQACWGCGITHALVAAVRWDFAEAWRANPRVVVVLPLLAVVSLRFALRTLRNWRAGRR
jgi:Protein of unknown function (DUF2752)